MGVSAVTTLSQVGFCTGWALNLYVMDESCAHDASAICEILGLTLEEIQRISKATGKPMPTTLLLCSDNTVREAKNQHVTQMLIALASKFKMKVTGLLNLRKSHTHDLLDQLWGILARRVANADRFQSPETVMAILRSELERPGLKGWVGKTTVVNVQKLNVVRAWKDHFAPQQAKLSGGLLEDASSNHVFMFFLRRGTG